MEKADIERTMGTSFKGKFIMPYDVLVKALGAPHWQYVQPLNGEVVEDKVDVSWCFEFEEGQVVTIYNWKDGRAYNGRDGLEIEDLTEWHIGGNDYDVVHLLAEEINARLDAAEDGGAIYEG